MLEAIVAGHGPGNIYSKQLLGRLGFTFTHEEPWGALNVLHPYYRLERSKASLVKDALKDAVLSDRRRTVKQE